MSRSSGHRAFAFIFLTLALTAGLACHNDVLGPPTGSTCPVDSTLTWDTFGREFMTTYCTRCHSESIDGPDRQGAPKDHNFDAAAQVREQMEHVDESAAAGPDAVNMGMPLGDPTPTEEERRKLGEWLACGAP